MTAYRRAPADTPPDPETARTPAEFVDRLRRLKVWAGDPSYEQLRRRCGVPASTLSDAVSTRRNRLPSLPVLTAFLRGCGATPDEITRWEMAWRALRGVATPEPDRHRDEPHQLPADVSHFVGREYEVRSFADARSPVLVVGAPGVGKTALALHWAHRVASEYPDGQLFVDLLGFARQQPMTHARALRLFLEALGTPTDRIPVGVPARVARYRSLTYDRRILVLLDNARDAEQVRPLLPGGPHCTTVITSRDRLSGLVAREGASRLTLAPMPPVDAEALLTAILGHHRTVRDRVATRELARLCGFQPLAIRVAAANLADQPYRSIAQYVSALTAGNRLAQLQIAGDDLAAVSTVFDVSYLALPHPARRLFRRLATLGSTEFTAHDATMLGLAQPNEAKTLLDTLVAAHLVELTAPDNYRLSDLAGLYATARQHTDDPIPRIPTQAISGPTMLELRGGGGI